MSQLNQISQSSVPSFRYLYVLSSFFAAILVISNVASSAKIVDMGFSIFGIPMAFDGGTLLFPFVYILGDVFTEVYGFKTARRVIWTGFAVMSLAAILFFVLGILPGEKYWDAGIKEAGIGSGTIAYNYILGGISTGGIVIASLSAYLVGKLSNALVLSKIKVIMKGRMLWVRTISSTIVGEALDTLIFVLIATTLGVFPWTIFWSLVITNYILKCLIEIAMTPLTYKMCNFLKKKEGVDVYG